MRITVKNLNPVSKSCLNQEEVLSKLWKYPFWQFETGRQANEFDLVQKADCALSSNCIVQFLEIPATPSPVRLALLEPRSSRLQCLSGHFLRRLSKKLERREREGGLACCRDVQYTAQKKLKIQRYKRKWRPFTPVPPTPHRSVRMRPTSTHPSAFLGERRGPRRHHSLTKAQKSEIPSAGQKNMPL